MIFNPIFGILHNTTTNRYHPITFGEKPLPGGPDADKPVRHKSLGHHTEGFDTREQALRWIDENKGKIPDSRLCVDKDFDWDGADVPAMVVFFSERDGKLIPAF